MNVLYPKLFSILGSNVLPNIPIAKNYYNEVLIYDSVPDNQNTNTFNINGVV